jgi:hypothetical protein
LYVKGSAALSAVQQVTILRADESVAVTIESSTSRAFHCRAAEGVPSLLKLTLVAMSCPVQSFGS